MEIFTFIHNAAQYINTHYNLNNKNKTELSPFWRGKLSVYSLHGCIYSYMTIPNNSLCCFLVLLHPHLLLYDTFLLDPWIKLFMALNDLLKPAVREQLSWTRLTEWVRWHSQHHPHLPGHNLCHCETDICSRWAVLLIYNGMTVKVWFLHNKLL